MHYWQTMSRKCYTVRNFYCRDRTWKRYGVEPVSRSNKKRWHSKNERDWTAWSCYNWLSMRGTGLPEAATIDCQCEGLDCLMMLQLIVNVRDWTAWSCYNWLSMWGTGLPEAATIDCQCEGLDCLKLLQLIFNVRDWTAWSCHNWLSMWGTGLPEAATIDCQCEGLDCLKLL